MICTFSRGCNSCNEEQAGSSVEASISICNMFSSLTVTGHCYSLSHAGGSPLGRGSLTLIGGLGAIGSLAAIWAGESGIWQGLRLLGRTGKATKSILTTVLSDSSEVQALYDFAHNIDTQRIGQNFCLMPASK